MIRMNYMTRRIEKKLIQKGAKRNVTDIEVLEDSYDGEEEDRELDYIMDIIYTFGKCGCRFIVYKNI